MTCQRVIANKGLNVYHTGILMETPSPEITDDCPNCGEPLGGKYCASCGQKRIDHHEFAVRHFFGHIVHEITHLDSNKILRTFWDLVSKPGLLTKEYLAGRKGQYINPIRIYLTVSAVYFLFAWGALSTAGGGGAQDMQTRPFFVQLADRKGVEPAVLAVKVQEKAGKYSAFLRFASVLVSGLFLMALYRGTGRYYVEHLIFSLHFYAFDFLLKCFVALIYLSSDYVGHTAYVVTRYSYYVYAPVFLFFALRRVYEQSLQKTLLKTAAQFTFETLLFIGLNIVAFVIATSLV
jgi:hypothetical protein